MERAGAVAQPTGPRAPVVRRPWPGRGLCSRAPGCRAAWARLGTEGSGRPAAGSASAPRLAPPLGGLRNSPACEASGGVTWKGFLRLLRRRVHVGACPHGPSLRSWARGRNLTAGRPTTDLEGSFTKVSAPSDTKHELTDSTTYRLLETYTYVSIVKCGN